MLRYVSAASIFRACFLNWPRSLRNAEEKQNGAGISYNGITRAISISKIANYSYTIFTFLLKCITGKTTAVATSRINIDFSLCSPWSFSIHPNGRPPIRSESQANPSFYCNEVVFSGSSEMVSLIGADRERIDLIGY